MASIGVWLLFMALVFSIYAVIFGIKGVRSHTKRGSALSVVAVASATTVLIRAFLTDDFSFAYVTRHSERHLATIYKVSALWAGQEGSLLLWLLILSLIGLVVLLAKRYQEDKLDLKIITVVNLVRIFFMVLLLTISSPFKTLAPVPGNGTGLNAMLQSFGMVIHPPILFLGYSAFLIPFAIIIVVLVTDDRTERWANFSRPWVLVAWTLLTAGIVTGGQWAYTELGWGGYWAWDPVENSSLFPWLTATALLHSYFLPPQGKQRKLWSFLLIIVTFFLTIFSTFLTRSGILDSVHAFANGFLGFIFLVFLFCLIAVSCYLLLKRRTMFHTSSSVKQEEINLTSKWQLINFGNVILFLIFGVVFLGTMSPLISKYFLTREFVLDESYYNQMSVPLFLLLIAVMGIAPLFDWQETNYKTLGRRLLLPFLLTVLSFFLVMYSSQHLLVAIAWSIGVFALSTHLQDLWDQRRLFSGFIRKIGGYIVHIGIIVVMLGVTGSIFDQQVYVTVAAGDEVRLCNYRFEYPGLDIRWQTYDYQVSTTLQIYSEADHIGEMTATKTFGQNLHQPATDVGIFSMFNGDLYFNLVGWDQEVAQLHIQYFPLVGWIWLGSGLIYGGMLVVIAAEFSKRRRKLDGESISS